MRTTKATFAILMCLGAAFAVSAHAADYYVSPDGTAAWADCSGATPLNGTSACSWQTAMANAVADDMVYFRGGTYHVGTINNIAELANMRPANSGAPGRPITFIAYPGEVPNITGTVVNGSNAAYFGCAYRDYIIWDGFAATMQIYTIADGSSAETWTWGSWDSNYCTIRNSNFTGVHQPYYNNTSFVRVERSNYALIENNYFHDLTATASVSVNAAAVYIFRSSYTTVRNNTMQNTYGGVFMKLGVMDYTDIHNNFIYNPTNAGHAGIQITNITGPSIRFHNNIIAGYRTAVEIMASVTASTDGLFVYNNTTIYSGNDTHDGINVGTPWAGVEVFNNIIMNFSPSLRYFDGVVSYSNYNNFYRPAGNVWNRNYATNYTSLGAWTEDTGFDANSITSDPLFVNAGGASPEGYKRTSYPQDGRGGAYATVMGAYITGDEVIGYSPTYVPDTLAPAAPSNLTVQ
ncbi:MAG TPA: right-handed parallel beta-helix repeat-containing protein [Acidiferrobacterales bacterium]|nr:right-handed parallel beta-helix repeat-containing protein [Acidiferrobacterales bacterium]